MMKNEAVMKLEQENNLIAKIYDAALLPALWLEVIQDIVSYTQSKSAIFYRSGSAQSWL